MLDGLAAEHGARLPFRSTTDLVDAVEGADFVFCAIRVGQLEGRVVDEDVPLGLGVLGQETTGPGGICFALRTIPVMVRLAETIAKHAPNAWLINFTNPAGMVTEAVQQVLGDRAVGICDSPSGLCRRVAAAVGRDAGRAVVRLLRAQPPRLAARACATPAAAQLLDGLLEDDERLDGFEEGRLFGGEWLRSLGMIPNEYLYYFYYAADTVNAIRGASASRGRVPARAAARVLRAGSRRRRARRLARHPPRPRAHLHGRGAQRRGRRLTSTTHDANAGYESEAMAVLEAIALNSRAGADPQHRQPLGAAVPGRARGRRGAVRRRPRRARCRWRWARCPRTRGRWWR